MRVFRYGPPGSVIAVYATFCVCAALAQVPTAPPPQNIPGLPDKSSIPPQQSIPGLPDPNSASPQQSIPGVPDQATAGRDQPADQNQNAGQAEAARGQRPLTAEELREREIEKYDPLNRSNPARRPLPGEAGASASPDGLGSTGANSGPDNRLPPLPGSVAESNLGPPANPNNAGPQVVSETGDAPTGPQYNGPAVLSRDYTLSRPTVPTEVKWNWTVSSSEIWQTGLVSGAGTSQAATTGSSFGTSASFSISGRHFWKEDQIGLNYGASYNTYFSSTSYNGTNQHLSLDYGHQFSRRLSLNLVENGTIFSANSTLQNPLTAPGVSVANINLAASPVAQVLDQTTRQFYTSVGLTWQQSSRLSFSFSGGFFAVQLIGPQLNGNVGYQAQGDTNYRLTKKTTVGVYYSYSQYTYTKHVAVSDSNTLGVIYSYALDRSTQLRLRGGLSWIETLAYTQVPIDPAFAALVGQTTGIVDAYSKRSTSDLSGQFVKDFGRSRTANVSYARGIAPGNGLILTSIQEAESVGFATTIFRRYSFSLTAGRTALTSVAQNTGSYASDFASLTFSRPLPRGIASSLSANYSRFSITNLPGLHSQFSVSSSVSWGPGAGKLW